MLSIYRYSEIIFIYANIIFQFINIILTFTWTDATIIKIAHWGVCYMAISYLKLWKLLLDKSMKKTDLIKVADISTTTLAKLSKNQSVSMGVMGRICRALSCDIGEIMEMIPDKKPEE